MELTPPRPGNVVAWKPPWGIDDLDRRPCEIVEANWRTTIVRIVAPLKELSPVETPNPAERWNPGRL